MSKLTAAAFPYQPDFLVEINQRHSLRKMLIMDPKEKSYARHSQLVRSPAVLVSILLAILGTSLWNAYAEKALFALGKPTIYLERVMTDMLKNVTQTTDLMRSVMQMTQDYNAKVLEFASANGNAALAYFSKLAATKTPSDLIELTTSHVREQTETMTRQARELTEIAQKVLPKVSS